MTSVAPQESVPERELGGHRYWAFVVDANYDPKSLFVSNTTIRWRLRRPLPIESGDIVYILSIGGRGLVGWALVREGATSQPPSSEGIQISLQILANPNKEVTLGKVARRLRVTQNVLQTERQLEITKDSAEKLNDLFDEMDTPDPEANPEVIKFRSELAERGQIASSAQIAVEGTARTTVDAIVEPGIGPLAAVEGKWARIADLIQLKLPNSESYFSGGVRIALGAACGISATRTSVEKYRVVDGEALLIALLALAKPGDRQLFGAGTSVQAVFDWLDKRGSGIASIIPDPPNEPDMYPSAIAVAAPSVTALLAEAARFARRTGADPPMSEKMHLRHMVTALLLSTDGRWALFNRKLVTDEPRSFFRELGSLLSRHVGRAHEKSDDLGAWRSILDQFNQLDLPRSPEPRSVTVQHTAYAADRPSKLADDALDVARDARALAELICLDEAQPPLAIGLFGDWGSGKSTFMDMLAEAIDELTARAAKQPALPFVDRVAHIRFNAWHYMDASLWASLVTHIFKELHRQSTDREQPRNWLKEAQLEGLIQRFGIVQGEEKAARDRLAEIATEIEGSNTKLAEIERECAKARTQLISDYAGDMMNLIWVGGPNNDVGDAALKIGLGRNALTARQLQEVIAEASTLAGRLKLMLTTLTTGTDWWLKGTVLGIFLLAFSLVGGGAAVVIWLVPELSAIATMLGTSLSIVLAVAGSLLPLLRQVNASLGPLIDAHNWVMTQFQQQELERAEHETAAKARLEELRVEQLEQERVRQQKLEERDRLAAISRGEKPTELLVRFIESRAQADDYRKRLGLLSFVRNDFELISSLMRQQRLLPDPRLPSIDRIVLYIDDLDRCQDKQVVQVLEAVHLLLAFDLFVVVVGVDARWLHRALKRIYRGQFGAGGADHASPADYLEKIFQIPFWLRPLDYGEQGTFGSLIDKLIGPDVEVTTPPPLAATPVADDESRSGAGDGPPPADAVERGGDEVTTIIAPVTVTMPEETPEETLQRVKLRDTEVALMKALGPLVGKSPRATKRFVNLYRLVRARKRGAELEAFLQGTDDAPAQYAAVMLVLGIEAGLAPRDAAAARRHMRALGEGVNIELPFDAGESEPDRKISGAVAAVSRMTGQNLLREHVVSVLGEITRYSFARPM